MTMRQMLQSCHDLAIQLENDHRLLPTHAALIHALFIYWLKSGLTASFLVTRRKLMKISKIASIATYHKCIRDLEYSGYILYKPSFHPQKGSQVIWIFRGIHHSDPN